MYEACVQTMLVSICITAILMIYTDKNKKIKDIFKYIICALGILGAAVILDEIIVKIINFAGVKPSDAAEKEINWGKYGILESLQLIIVNIISAIKKIKYYPVLIFYIVSVIGLAIGILQSDKNKRRNRIKQYIWNRMKFARPFWTFSGARDTRSFPRLRWWSRAILR